MVLSCNNISKAFGEEVILSKCSFNVEDNEKCAIVGINGVGKTTLLRIIVGELSADEGSVSLANKKSLGYLPQMPEIDSNKTIYDEMLEAKADVIELEEKIRLLEEKMKSQEGAELEESLKSYNNATSEFERVNGFAYKSEIVGVLKGLGFTEADFDKKVSVLSGGQKTRLALAKLLLSKPDVILLDEPINHLDLNSISWLEGFLSNYKGAVVIVAHDRYFLDHVVSKVVEIDRANTSVYMGNYSAYSKKKAEKMNAELNAYLNQQREIKHQEEVIEKLKSFNREKSIKRAESREKQLDKIEILDKPVQESANMKISLVPEIISGNDVLSVKGLSKSFGENTLFEGLDFEIKRGEKVAIIGNNGSGKTTILKIINGIEKADAGSLKLGSNVFIGYYDQEHNVLNPSKTIFEEIRDDYPELTNTKIRNVLASFLFTADDVFKKISSLSGGEKGRVSLAKLMLSKANFIILDEPTNHLDILSKEILENALNSYEGTILYVSHDRFFINKTAERILELSEEGLKGFLGNYDYYLQKKAEQKSESALKETKTVKESESKKDWETQKKEQAAKRKQENDLKKVEEQIDNLEQKKKELNLELENPAIATNTAELTRITKEINDIDGELEILIEKWEELA
ncbi:MAG: ABC-F family ATP-binding cassette domain-containing protein [Lachnospiraceae bacterium]|nr:ABC-F family ATP-binding cassette domain-containing protein [Lachnospiraceae bacterium]